jgi:hypothetical protein
MIPSAQKTFMPKLPAATARNATQYPGRLANGQNPRRSDHRFMPNAHFQGISSDWKTTSYAGDKLMMFWACCCATKHFLSIFMTP